MAEISAEEAQTIAQDYALKPVEVRLTVAVISDIEPILRRHGIALNDVIKRWIGQYRKYSEIGGK